MASNKLKLKLSSAPDSELADVLTLLLEKGSVSSDVVVDGLAYIREDSEKRLKEASCLDEKRIGPLQKKEY